MKRSCRRSCSRRGWAAIATSAPSCGAARATNAARGLWLDFDEPYRGDDLDAVDAQDPMYALLGQLARAGNGASGRELFTDADRASYLFAERDVLADGGVAIVTAAANAAAGPDVVAGAPSSVLDDASLVASGFVNLFGPANARRARADDRAATGAARILGAHMYGVQHALGSDNTVTDGERRRELGGDADPQNAEDVPAAAIAELANGAFASSRTAAVFDPPALTSIVRLAARTDAGIAGLRIGLSRYDQAIAASTAARLADGGIAPSHAPAHLAEVMTDAARLEGTLLAHVGEEAREGERDRDALLTFWIRGIGTGRGRRYLAAGSEQLRRGRGRCGRGGGRPRGRPGQRRARGRHRPRGPGRRRRRAPDVPVGARAARRRSGRRPAPARDRGRRRAPDLRGPRRDPRGRRPAWLGGDDRDPAARRVAGRHRGHRRRSRARRHAAAEERAIDGPG